VGIARELWRRSRALGDGMPARRPPRAARCDARQGDRQRFRILRERLDVESAMSVPLCTTGVCSAC